MDSEEAEQLTSSSGDEGMAKYLRDFEVPAKRSSEEALRRWRASCSLVRNRRRRFRFVANLEKRSEALRMRQLNQEKLRVAVLVSKAAFSFIQGIGRSSIDDTGAESEDTISDHSSEARHTSFNISPDELAEIVKGQSLALKRYSGVLGIAKKLVVVPDHGVSEYHRPSITERKHHFGSNLLDTKREKGFWTFLWEASQDMILIVLASCSIISICLGIAVRGWPKGIYEGLGILFIIIMVIVITAISDYKQYLLFLDLIEAKKETSVLVTRDGKKKLLPVSDVVVGDVVSLSIGDRVPADGLFLKGDSMLVDQSSITGESTPIDVWKERPFLLSGSMVQEGSGLMLVTSVGKKTEWGKLMVLLREDGEDETPLQVQLNGVATYVGRIGLTLSLVFLVALLLRYIFEKAQEGTILKWSAMDMLQVLKYAALSVTTFMCSVPEGLPLAVILSLAFAMRKLLNERALVRHPSACEAMGSVTCICVDKTGTLTTNEMKVDKIWICNKLIRGSDNVNVLKSTIPESLFYTIIQSFCLNTFAGEIEEEGTKRILGSPTESALLLYGLYLATGLDAISWKHELKQTEPFNSFRKKMSVLIALPHGGTRALSKGAPDVILKMCDKIIDENGKPVSISRLMQENVMKIVHSFSSEALRTLCFAYQDISDDLKNENIPSSGYSLLAIVGLYNPLRPRVKSAVDACNAAGITVRMVTGDNIDTAKALAKECGILTDDGLAIEGSDFRSKTPEELKELIPKIQVLASSMPDDKLRLVTNLQTTFREVVAVTGDGTNDGPALREADIGLTMGITGTEVAKENADIVIMDDNFATIVNLVKVGRAVIVGLQNFFQFQLTVNIVAIMLDSLSASITGSPPLTPVQLIWVNMIADILGALALATEPASDNVMEQPPFRRTGFISPNMWRNILVQSIYQLLVLLVLKFTGKWLLKLGDSSASTTDTFVFNTFIFFQVFNKLNCHETQKLNVFHGIWNNWLFLSVILFIVAFQVVLVEYMGSLANTVPLSWQQWLLSVLIGSTSLLIVVIPKRLKPAKNPDVVYKHDNYTLLPTGPDQA